MAKDIKSQQRFVDGIADYIKEGSESSYAHGRSIDHRTDPRSIKLLPKTIKESGTVISDLIKFGTLHDGSLYTYGSDGNIYKRTSAGAWSLLRTVSESHGNGISYFAEDDFIYYAGDKVIGRYGLMSTGETTFVDDYFGSQGGTRLNTDSLNLESGSSQYAYSADTATLSLTSDLTLEAQVKPESLPTGTDSQTIISKWNGSGNLRSYKFDIATESNYFGDGSDGAKTIAANTTDTPIDSACTGTSGAYTLSATNASFAAGQIILIHQSRGTGAGAWQRNTIQSYTAGTITLVKPLNRTYSSGAQVLVLKQYTNVTVNSGKTWTVKAWNGTTGGILAFLANGTVTITGTISANGTTATATTGKNTSIAGATGGGFRGGIGYTSNSYPYTSNSGYYNGDGGQGEGTGGAGNTRSRSANGNGGGGGGANYGGHFGGAGGGNASAGIAGNGNTEGRINYGGTTSGSADLTSMTFGGGGGGESDYSTISQPFGGGASGGGIIFMSGATVTVTGSVTANGGNGSSTCWASGGAGAGGSILIKAQTATLGSGKITATGGSMPIGICSPPNTSPHGGNGANGRIHLDYYTSYTGSTSPTVNVLQDNNLGTSDGLVIRLAVSDDGTSYENLSKPIELETDVWQHLAVVWDASESSAEFFINGVSLGADTGAMTGIDDNASEFFVGANKNDDGDAANFYDGLIDEVRIWNTKRTSSQLILGSVDHILATSAYLNAYYKFNGDVTDETSNSNDLTASGSPTYSDDVPFYAPTTRLDIDQSATTAGDTYTLATSISEGATHKLTFTPEKDPQKSVSVLVAAVGTGNWTLTVHDQFDNEIATKTVANASMAVGYFEFVFDDVWRPLLNAEYHFHLTSTVADGTVTTTSNNDLETVSYRTYYQFLVEDTDWHPIYNYLQYLIIGNERYVAKYEATLYEPHQLTLRAGDRVRCFATWGEYLAIGVMRGDEIYSEDSGRIYFWDGTAETYNYFIDVPEGGINAMLGTTDGLYIVAGYQGDLLLYNGGADARVLKQLPKIDSDEYMGVYPSAITMWKGLLRVGGGGDSDSTNFERGIYTWGAVNERYNNSLSFDYPVSTGNYLDTVKIGYVTVVNKKLLIGWQDNVGFGVDYVAADNDPYATGTIEFLQDDDNLVWKEKRATTVVAHFLPLEDGESVDVKYRIDRADAWTSLGAVTDENATEARLKVASNGGRYKEIQYAVDLATTTTTSPTLLSCTIEKDLLKTEGRV